MSDVADLTEVREQIEAIRREASDLGYALTGEKLSELREEIAVIRAEREGKPPCYRRAYDRGAPHCRVCDLLHRCSADEVPAYVPVDELRPEPCSLCGIGALTVELIDQATGDVRDYGCSSTGCTGTLLGQSKAPEPEPEPVRTKRAKLNAAALGQAIMDYVRSKRPRSKKQIVEAIPASDPRVRFALNSLIEGGKIVRRNKRYEVSDANA